MSRLLIFAAASVLFGLLLSVVFNFFPQGEHYKATQLDNSLIYASVGRSGEALKWLAQDADRIVMKGAPPPGPWLSKDCQIIILVHGYNAVEDEIGHYFDDLVAYVRENVSAAHSIVVYDWPSSASVVARGGALWLIADFFDSLLLESYGIEKSNYRTARHFAESTASSGLAELIRLIKERTDARVTVIAHSMGGRVVIRALTRDPELGSMIGTLVLLAPDVNYDVLARQEIFHSVARVGRVHVYYSGNDGILQFAETLGGGSTRLGLHGPKDQRFIPGNVQLHDVTGELGESDVHGKYLTSDGLRAMKLSTAFEALPHPRSSAYDDRNPERLSCLPVSLISSQLSKNERRFGYLDAAFLILIAAGGALGALRGFLGEMTPIFTRIAIPFLVTNYILLAEDKTLLWIPILILVGLMLVPMRVERRPGVVGLVFGSCCGVARSGIVIALSMILYDAYVPDSRDQHPLVQSSALAPIVDSFRTSMCNRWHSHQEL